MKGFLYTVFSGQDGGYDIALQTDGKIVTVGTSMNSDGVHSIAVSRLMPNGTPDNTFGNFGKVVISSSRIDQYVESVIIQPDGKIVAAGRYKSLATTPGSNIYYFLTIRLNSNGTLDNSFNGTGKVLTTWGSGNCMAQSVALQTDGKIVVGGQNYTGLYNDFAFARYNSNGTPDNTFGVGGKKIIGVSMKEDYCNEIAIQKDGRIVATGITDKAAGFGYRAVATIRLLSNGNSDISFGNNGFVITDVGANDDAGGLSIALQSDGKIVVSGHDMNDNDLQGYFLVARYNFNGTIDASFNNGNVVLTPVQYFDRGESVAIQTDGKIVVAGMVEDAGGFQFNSCVLRYTTAGALDNTFAGGVGYVVTNFGGVDLSAQDWLTGVAIQKDGKIVASGLVQTTLFNPFYFLNVRYNGDGAPIALMRSDESQEMKVKSSISVYPNPATNFINVTGLDVAVNNKLVIKNIQGNTMREVNVNTGSSCLINIETLPRGTYFITLFTGTEGKSVKFVKN